MGVSYFPARGAVKSVQEVNATFTSTNTGAETTYEVALSTTVDKSRAVFVPTGHAGAYQMTAEGYAGYGMFLKGITIKSDGTALAVRVFDNQAYDYRLTGFVVEYY